MGNFNKIGLVLAGGGAKGAYQIGALKAIKELGLLHKVGPVAGTSIGGINLALYVTGDIDKAEIAWRNFKGADFIDFDDNGFDPFKMGDGIFSRDALLNILDKNVDYDKVSGYAHSLYVTVCYKDDNSDTHKKYILLNGLSRDKLRQYMMATSAIPVVYDAVNIDGVLYFDGGMKDNTPIKALSHEDVSELIVISNDYKRSLDADIDKFPEKKVINIVPSASLDMDTIDGTVDFQSLNAAYRIKLGYLDAIAILNAYIGDYKVPDLSGNATIARSELKMVKLEAKVNNTMGNLNDMLKKYGID